MYLEHFRFRKVESTNPLFDLFAPVDINVHLFVFGIHLPQEDLAACPSFVSLPLDPLLFNILKRMLRNSPLETSNSQSHLQHLDNKH